jgi:hypothetical protein
MAINLAPFGRWTLRDKAAQRRLALRYLRPPFLKGEAIEKTNAANQRLGVLIIRSRLPVATGAIPGEFRDGKAATSTKPYETRRALLRRPSP